MTRKGSEKLLLRLRRPIEVNLHVLRRPPGRYNVQFLVPIEIRERQILASHPAIVDHALAPFLALQIERPPKENPVRRTFLPQRATPADNDVIRAHAEYIAETKRVAFSEFVPQHGSALVASLRILRGRNVCD